MHREDHAIGANVDAPRATSLSSGSEAATPTPQKFADDATPTPTDSMVSISLTDSDRTSTTSSRSVDTTPDDVVSEVLKRASVPESQISSIHSVEAGVDAPGAEARLVEEVTFEKARSRAGSVDTTRISHHNRGRSDSSESDRSLEVDWESLDKTEQKQEQDQESDEVRQRTGQVDGFWLTRSSKQLCFSPV
jgi:hypothetical protein